MTYYKWWGWCVSPKGSVSGRVFMDRDGDSTELNGGYCLESGFRRVTVELLDKNENVVDTTITDAFGCYKFDKVAAGTYTVRFVEPDGYDFVEQDVGSVWFDSDADQQTGETQSFYVGPGCKVTQVDAGLKDAPDDICPDGDPIGTENISGTEGDDALSPQDGFSATIAGNEGNDVIDGGGYDDFILGNNGNDTLYGNCGDDTLYGGRDDDLIYGGAGDDIISGDFGSDTISGGSGADTFRLINRFVEADEFDIVEDFDLSEGDQFDLADIDPASVLISQNGADAEIYVGGDLEFVVAGADAAEVQSVIFYDVA